MMEYLQETAELDRNWDVCMYTCLLREARKSHVQKLFRKYHVIYTSVTSGDVLDAVDLETVFVIVFC